MVDQTRVTYRRGDVVTVNLEPTTGGEQRGHSRPCVVVQNNAGNENFDTTTIVPLTDANDKTVYPFQALIPLGIGGLEKDSIAKCEQVRVIDGSRISNNWGHLDETSILRINNALRNHLGI